MYFICVIYYHFVALARSIPEGLHVGSTIGTEMNYDFAPTK